MEFDTKVALVIRADILTWQKLNVAAFLATGIVAAHPESVGEPYGDASGTVYHALMGQPILIYEADLAALQRALERSISRGVKPALYTHDMFSTKHDAENRAAVRSVERDRLDLVGLAFRAPRKVVDKIVDGLKFHAS